MLRCRREVSSAIFDSYGGSGRESETGMGDIPGVFHERTCLACPRQREGQPLGPTVATLHTMGGHIAFRTGAWTKSCGADVAYDGADSALFAFSSKTVSTCVHLDVASHIALTSRSSFSAADAAMAFCLHATAGSPLAASGLARQMLSCASGLYTETLIMPASSFAFSRCLAQGKQNTYPTIIADGQVQGIFMYQAVPFVRHVVDNQSVDLPLWHGFSVKSAAIRSAIRKRCSTNVCKSSTLTAHELKALTTFIVASSDVYTGK